MTVVVRPATYADARAVATVHVRGWKETYPGIVPKRVLDRLEIEDRTLYWQGVLAAPDPGSTLLVAERDGVVVGFGASGAETAGLVGYPGEFRALYVLAEAQGQGIGRLLMRDMAAHLVAMGWTRSVVWALRDNRRARRFYERLGGRLLAERPLDFDGAKVMEVAYAWPDVRPLAQGGRAA